MRKIKEISLGELKLYHFSTGLFKLDGGAMFGIVPKVLWKKFFQADKKNRITLGMNPLLVKGKGFTLIIDTGIGNKWNEKDREIYGIKLRESPFQNTGIISTEEITHCVLTHLHFDHAGGATVFNEGKLVPSFPNATYYVQKIELEDALIPNERTKASYKHENFAPLLEKGVLKSIEGTLEILPGIKLILTGGHTRGHQIVLIESKEQKALYFADLVPTSYHIPIPYIMGYDTLPLETLEMRKKLYKKALEENILLFFEHDPVPRRGFLKKENEKYFLEEVK